MRCVGCVDSRTVRSPAGGTGIDHLPSNEVLEVAKREDPEVFEVGDRDIEVRVIW